jgi:hypothetical protein
MLTTFVTEDFLLGHHTVEPQLLTSGQSFDHTRPSTLFAERLDVVEHFGLTPFKSPARRLSA